MTDTPTPTPLDKLDRPIHVGDFIVYGHALGRCAALKIGRVLEIKRVDPTHREGSPWRLTVVGWDEASWREPRVSRGTLQFPDRAIVVREADVPVHVVRVLTWEGT